MNIYFIRHTAVDVPKGVCYGQSDVPLKPTFEAEAEIVKKGLSTIPFDKVYASPLTRCKRLAHYCIDAKDEITFDDRLKELDFGDWEMKEWGEIDFKVWEEDWIGKAVPNGESFKLMLARVSEFIDELREKPYENVIIFTHGGVCSCANVYFEHIKIEEAFELKTEYGQIIHHRF